MPNREDATTAVFGTAKALAEKAKETGLTVYAPKLERPSNVSAAMLVDPWGAAVAGIEAAGWTLDRWAADADGAYPLFRLTRRGRTTRIRPPPNQGG